MIPDVPSLSHRSASLAVSIFGAEGQRWVDSSPRLIAGSLARWGLEVTGVPDRGSLAYVAFVRDRSGRDLVLKLSPPHPERETEIETLTLFGGRRAPRVIDAAADLGALLMERLAPGHMLLDLPGNAAQAEVAADVMRAILIPVPEQHALPAFADWLARASARVRDRFGPDCGPIPRELVDTAEQLFADIDAGNDVPVVLHGDLHHENILLDEQRGWCAIDPKGAIGDRRLEVGRYLQNRLPAIEESAAVAVIGERADVLSNRLGYERDDILRCGLIDVVLSTLWHTEERDRAEAVSAGVARARLLRGMLA